MQSSVQGSQNLVPGGRISAQEDQTSVQEGQPSERTRTLSYTDEFLKFAGASVSR